MGFKLGSERRADGTHHSSPAKLSLNFKGLRNVLGGALGGMLGKRRNSGEGIIGKTLAENLQNRYQNEQNEDVNAIRNQELMADVGYNDGRPPVFQNQMEEGTIAQANMDGSIDIDPSVDPNSAFGKRVIKHEQEHIRQMESGEAAYDDNWVMWQGKLYIRQNGYIDGPNGKFEEGDPNHPWEAQAIKAEKRK